MRRFQLPSVRQIDLLFGRTLHLPDDGDGAEVVDLSPAQSTWMGDAPPRVASCPGCVLFGCCALHEKEDP